MKKIYFLALASMVGSMSFGQSTEMNQGVSKINAPRVDDNIEMHNKAQGVTLWSDSFDTPGNWVIDGSGNQGDWVIGMNADVPEATGYMGDMASTTFGDGFAFFDGVQYLLAQNVETQNAWIEMATAVDMTGYNRVVFQFEQRYRAFNSDVTYVEVSLDGGTTWQGSVDVNVNEATNDPAVQNTKFQEFQVNGSTQVKFRFRWEETTTDNQFGSGYGWFVDDVRITTLPDNDIEVTSNYYGTEGLFYYQIPEKQTAPIDFTANVRNAGINDQNGVQLQATETLGSGYVGTSPAAVVASSSTDSLVVGNPFTPSTQGSYNIDLAILNDSVDDNPTNNLMGSYSFDVGENIYARDNDVIAGSITGFAQTPPVTVEPGNLFDIWADDTLYALDITLGDDVAEGIEVYGTIYEIDANGDFVFVAETEQYMTGANDVNAALTLQFPTEVELAANTTYLVTAASFATEFSVATAGSSEPQTSFVYGDLGSGGVAWYYMTSTPMVRMNLDKTLSVENNELSTIKVSQYPNPFANETTVNYSLQEASAVEYSVVDMAGNVIATGSEGNQNAGEHSFTIDGSSFANGVYYLELTAGENKVTRRMVVNK